ncbi:MAG: serine/threonine protein kinase [Deltaproteobacteria bacterium]|nr:serine/threonine protein kinase [Deltaproteobacteria bacterium]
MASPPRAAPGSVFAGRFKIRRQLARGGLGTILEVEELASRSVCALKVMHPQFTTDESMVARFAQEARAAMEIPSPHVVKVFGSGVDDATGAPWIAMELLRGEDLETRLGRVGHLSLQESGHYLGQLCDALAQAHTRGYVHRDIKPENVFLADTPEGGSAVKVLDFGISKWVSDQTRASENSALIGTPDWMAPEQAQGGAQISPSTDVWALGLVTFRMLTGKGYWKAPPGAVAALITELLIDPLEPAGARASALGAPGALPPGFDGWFARCVHRDPHQRFADAQEAWTHLAPLVAGGAGSSQPSDYDEEAATVQMDMATFGNLPHRASQPQAPARDQPQARVSQPPVRPSTPMIRQPTLPPPVREPPGPQQGNAWENPFAPPARPQQPPPEPSKGVPVWVPLAGVVLALGALALVLLR